MTDELTPKPDLDRFWQSICEQDKLDLERSSARSERRKLLRTQKKCGTRGRALYDFPPGLIKMVADIAEEARMTNSQVAGLLLLHALRDYRQGKIDLRTYREPSESPRYDFRIDLDDLFESWDFNPKP